MGQIGILNVGAGDTKLTFDKNNPAECIRSARIVTDMLRRGYALLIEVTDKKGNMVTDQEGKFATTNLDLPNWYSLVIYEIDAENPRDADDIVAEVIKVAGTEALPFTSSMNWEGMTQFVAEPMGTATKA